METFAIAAVIVIVLALLSSMVIFTIALTEFAEARAAGAKQVTESKQQQFWVGYQLLVLPVIYMVMRLPCSSWPWLVEHAVLSAGLSGGLVVGGACLAIVLSKREAVRWHRAIRVVANLLMLAGMVGLFSTAIVGNGCHLQSKAPRSEAANNQASSRYAPGDTPFREMLRGAGRQFAWSAFALNDSVQVLRELGAGSPDAASVSGRGYTRLTKRVEEFSRSVSLLGFGFAIALTALLILATRRGVGAWAGRAGWRRVLRTVMVGLAGIVFLPFSFSVVGVYFAQVLTPTYLVSAWAAGTVLGIVVTLWLVFAPSAPRSQPVMPVAKS